MSSVTVKVRPGSLYHAVDRLVVQGLAVITGTEREGNRPERTNYEISDAGRKALATTVAELLRAPVNEYPRFAQAVSECHNLPRGHVVGMLRSRMAALELQITALESATADANSTNVEARYVLDLSYNASITRAEIDWITRTVAEIEGGELEWPRDDDCRYRYPQ